MYREDHPPPAAATRLIRLIEGRPRLVEDEWQLLARGAIAGERPPILHLASWARRPRDRRCGIWIGPEDDFEDAPGFFAEAALVAVYLPSFRDGRSLAVAHRLRHRHGWRGELRATGDVLREQLRQLRRCGFDSFALAPGEDAAEALRTLSPRGAASSGPFMPRARRRP